ncbi:MAG TPA: AAA family ATPase [Geminicoccaceae bacterium]|nr:AAA family ATPase [Geminicoccaceae bacterium]
MAAAQILRSPWLWHGLFGVVLLVGLLTGHSVLLPILPVLAALAWIYVAWRLVAAHRTRRRAVAFAPTVPDRTRAAAPPIEGDVAAPAEAKGIDPADMRAYLTARIIGQDVVAAQLARGIHRRMAQHRRGKPVFTALLSGPTGTGKTELARAVADYLYGGGMFRVDCGNVLGEAGLQTLIGSPKGYAGSGSWGALTSHLRSTPRTVLLFDEIEKAVTSPNAPMAKLLLSLLDEGVCTEQSDGTRVGATEAVILLTSNAAQDRLGAVFERFREEPEQLIRATKDTLRDHFAPEFLARIDLVTTLAPLDDAARARIIALHTGRIGRAYGVEVRAIDASFVNEALRLWTTLAGYGTREVIRWVEDATADELIRAKGEGAAEVRVGWADGAARVTAA